MALDSGQPGGRGGAAVPAATKASAALRGGGGPDPDGSLEGSGVGYVLWLAMTVGARRGELCALRRRHVDLDAAVLTIEISVSGRRSAIRQKDTKTHQMRRVALDAESVEILREQLDRQDERIRQLGLKTARNPFLFSLDPDCGTPLLPDSVSQRFDRLAARLDIDTSLHKLRQLQRHRVDRGWRRRTHCRRSPRPRRGRGDDSPRLCRVGERSRPPCGWRSRLPPRPAPGLPLAGIEAVLPP